ncbi:MAG: cholesterol esterase [Vezdaea aestivalis]|nr:MAG: cholesterol esterase [Vezdaea aestivalis]
MLTPWRTLCLTREYLALLGSFILIGLEFFIRIITFALPTPIIRFFYKRSRSLFNSLSSPQSKKSRAKKKNFVTSIRDASDFVDLCDLYGYYAEEHVIQTTDGYLLGLHRLGWRKGEEHARVNHGEGSIQKPVVYLHHGLLMNSEVWVCITEKERCLPFALLESGYDVWFGNNRGNKYSKKSTLYSPTSNRFWDFSMDQFAFHDIPDSIDYILNTTGQTSLSFIGFSQGTAQGFAALAVHPSLNHKINVFIALAPAMAPAGLSNGVVDALMKASPEVIFLAFGRKMILSSTATWQAILYPPIFVRIIDICLHFLFSWTGHNISPHQKLAAYSHLYSYTSTKSVVHWFQIIRNKSFQMYDDDVQTPLSLGGSGGKFYKVARFPTRNIKTPVVLVYGGSDSLVDIKVMQKQLPRHTVSVEIPHYEHLDFLWGSEVDRLVFPHVFSALERSRSISPALLPSNGNLLTAAPMGSDSEMNSFTAGGNGSTTAAGSSGAEAAPFDMEDEGDLTDPSHGGESPTPSKPKNFTRFGALRSRLLFNSPSSPSQPSHLQLPSSGKHSRSNTAEFPGDGRASPSADSGSGDGRQSPSTRKRSRREASTASLRSHNSSSLGKAAAIGKAGISLGVGSPVGGVDRSGAQARIASGGSANSEYGKARKL